MKGIVLSPDPDDDPFECAILHNGTVPRSDLFGKFDNSATIFLILPVVLS